MDPASLSALTCSGHLALPSNLALANELAERGGRMVRHASGHLVLYGPHGRRILATDPEGNPLHECEWNVRGAAPARLASARVRLDWGQWVGIKPGGLVNETALDLSKNPSWQGLRPDDLRQMAAGALGLPFEEVRFFYGDDDLTIEASGRATIRHLKDALYLLDDGTFQAASHRVRFMACMGAMHWERIDFLPVVELFQSLLPGTGSAAFELIRGLYDDQNEDTPNPLPLRYRGIPTYPSEAAYRLFSAFFTPRVPGDGDPVALFMDPRRAHQVTWLPSADPPQRYFDAARKLCVTIQGHAVTKATLADDPAGLSFVNTGPHGFAPCDRSIRVADGKLVLRDGERLTSFPLNPAWEPITDSSPARAGTHAVQWRNLFANDPPAVEPSRAFSSVLLYPDDETEIGEIASHPFVADFLQDESEQRPDLATAVQWADKILIKDFDGAVTTCVQFDRPRDCTIVYTHPEFAQKHAQAVWNRLAQAGHAEWGRRIQFWRADAWKPDHSHRYDLVYLWISFAHYEAPATTHEIVCDLTQAMAPGGVGFVAGPLSVVSTAKAHGLRVLDSRPVEALPTFRMHRAILPKARLKTGLYLTVMVNG